MLSKLDELELKLAETIMLARAYLAHINKLKNENKVIKIHERPYTKSNSNS